MDKLTKLLSKHYQKHFKISESEANDFASEGSIEEIDSHTIAHLFNRKNHERRDVYIVNLDELILKSSEEKNKDGEWARIIL